ncbi:Las1-domain-containing protein, partial [Melanomma pulvis-pyrius CBS 109.77]
MPEHMDMDMDTHTETETHARAHYVVTPWRDAKELLDLRRCLFPGEGDVDRRAGAVNKVFAWRARKLQIPLLLDSTADLVLVGLVEERGRLEHQALRLLYATAVSRFITGVSDTLIELTRLRPSWFPPGKTLTLPASLLETRHCIVHRQLPSLSALKSAARQSLDWLWEWYWSQLDVALDGRAKDERKEVGLSLGAEEVRAELQAVLKAYMRGRKTEIKTRQKQPSEAAQTALSSYLSLATQPQTQHALLALLVTDKAILPADKKLGTSMSGAFLIWSPLLLQLCLSSPQSTSTRRRPFTHILVEHLQRAMNSASPFGVPPGEDPAREGMHAWLVRILTSDEWRPVRVRTGRTAPSPARRHRREGSLEARFVEQVLGTCFTAPTLWNLRVAESVLEAGGGIAGREGWV